MKTCQYCAEEIQDAAIVCKHCGKDITPAATVQASPKTTKTVVLTYSSENEMQKDIRNKESKGWRVLGTQRVPQGYAAGKTCCLGILFLPLALFGKKSDLFQVTYQFEETGTQSRAVAQQKQDSEFVDFMVKKISALGVFIAAKIKSLQTPKNSTINKPAISTDPNIPADPTTSTGVTDGSQISQVQTIETLTENISKDLPENQ